MKAFFILVLLVMMFLVIASSTLAQVDLTPDTPPAVSGQTSVEVEPDVIVIQENDPSDGTVEDVQVIPVTGSCSSPYIVRSGDTLSSIAVLCNTTVADIRLANPQITNINLIYTGQQLVIPGASTTQPNSPPVPVTGSKELLVPLPTTQSNLTIQPTPTPLVIIPDTGNLTRIASGTQLNITARNFPASTPLVMTLREVGGADIPVASGITGEDGVLAKTILLPEPARSDARYTITVTTTALPQVQASSQPFMIIAGADE